MATQFFDTHCHLMGSFYKGDVQLDLISARAQGVSKIVLPGTDEADSKRNVLFAEQNTGVYAAVGLHPSEARTPEASDFLEQFDFQKIVALGETGIDLYHKSNPPLAMQLIAFRKHIVLALKHNKPLIIHARNAEADVYAEVIKYPQLKMIMHCYTGGLVEALKFAKLGAFISIAGVITYDQSAHLRLLVQSLPLSQLLVETDAPFLTPVPKKGHSNKPEFVIYTARFIAELREEAESVVLKALYDNAHRAFGLAE